MTSKVGEQVCNNSIHLGVLCSTVEVHWESRNTRGTIMGHRIKGSCHLCHSEWGDGRGQELMLQPGVKLTQLKCTKDRSEMLTKILQRGLGEGAEYGAGPRNPAHGMPEMSLSSRQMPSGGGGRHHDSHDGQQQPQQMEHGRKRMIST